MSAAQRVAAAAAEAAPGAAPARRRLRALKDRVAAWLLVAVVRLWRKSVRVTLVHDPRPALRRRGVPYVYAVLHGQQVAALLAHDEPAAVALVSRSRDGALLARVLRHFGVLCVRGSSRKGARDKGGREALEALVGCLDGARPAIVAVDGPRGPRGVVRRGALVLAARTGAAVLPVVASSRRRWRLLRAWDHAELPWPGQRIDVHFLPPILAPPDARHPGVLQQQWVDAARARLEEGLRVGL